MQIVGSYQKYSAMAYRNMSMSAAAYDFVSELTENSMAQSCLSNYTFGVSQCMYNYTEAFIHAYRINDIGIIGKGGNSSYARTYCTNSTKNIICVGVS